MNMKKIVIIPVPYGQAVIAKTNKEKFLDAIAWIEDFCQKYDKDRTGFLEAVVKAQECPLSYAYLLSILYGQATIAKDMTKDEIKYVNCVVNDAINTIVKINKSLCHHINVSISEFNKIADNNINEIMDRFKDIPTDILEAIVKERKSEK